MFARTHSILSTRWRWFVLMLAGFVAAAVLTAVSPAPKAQAAELPGTIVDGGYIISDAEFYKSNSMTMTQIQTFLKAKASSCAKGATCLKDYRGNITARKADTYCKALAGEKKASAARMIYRAARACGINPKVILVMLQKEQGLVTSTKPSDWNIEHAMGQSCPDTPAGCSAAAAGFWNQVYLGARQMQIYTKYPASFGYRAKQYNTIKWAPSSSCGTSKVYIKNQATANLYNYTPYRPNIAALAAGYGTGDKCSTYGNRNFYNYYVSWFAPGASKAKGAPAQVGSCTVPATADVATRSATATVKVEALNARKAPTTLCGSGMKTLDKGTKVTVTGVYGAWSHIKVGSSTLWVVSEYLKSSSGSSSGGGSPASVGCAQPASVSSASGTAVVTVAALNARTAPSTACTTGVQTLKQGQKYARTGTSGVWWRLKVGTKTLWAHSDYLALEKAASTPKPTTKPTPKPTSKPPATTKPATTTKYVAVSLNLRTGTSRSAKILTTMPRGAKVTVLKKSGSWSQIKYGSRTGWAANAYLTSSAISSSAKPSTSHSTAQKTIAALNLRTSASLSAKIVMTLPRGAKVSVLKKSGSWSQVKYGSRAGWVANAYLASISSSASKQTAASSSTKHTITALNLRTSASLSAKIVMTLPRSAKVTVVKKSGSWSHVKYGSRSGWVANKYLK